MDEPEDWVGELRFAGRVGFYGGEGARQLAEVAGLAYRGGLAVLEYTDDAEQHWSLIVDGEAYRAQVSPFLDVEGETHTQQTGDWDWKPDQLLMTLHGWPSDFKRENA